MGGQPDQGSSPNHLNFQEAFRQSHSTVPPPHSCVPTEKSVPKSKTLALSCTLQVAKNIPTCTLIILKKAPCF